MVDGSHRVATRIFVHNGGESPHLLGYSPGAFFLPELKIHATLDRITGNNHIRCTLIFCNNGQDI
jgi:hypothetical protein